LKLETGSSGSRPNSDRVRVENPFLKERASASAETDVSIRAEILSYSRARGLFAGVSLEGSTIRPDNDANERIYGEKISAKDIVIAHETHVPLAAEGLISTLNAKTPKHKSS
jgi:SH3 domain-containing YSC84-like protein 1